MESLSDPQVWKPLLKIVRKGLNKKSPEAVYTGYIGDGSYSADKSLLDAVGQIREQVKPTGQAYFRVQVSKDGRERIDLVQWPTGVESETGDRLAAVHLVDNAITTIFDTPAPPATDADLSVAPTADPEYVRSRVTAMLPEATGVDPAALDTIEADLGVRLPDDVRALYLCAAEGDLFPVQDNESGAVESDSEEAEGRGLGFEIVALDDVATRGSVLPAQRFAGFRYATLGVHDGRPVVRLLIGSPWWFVFGHDGGGNYFACDLTPSVSGVFGQVVWIHHEDNAGAILVADSLTDALRGNLRQEASSDEFDDHDVTVDRKKIKKVTEIAHSMRVLGHEGKADLSKLAGHRGLKNLEVASENVTDITAVKGLPSLEYLETDPAGLRALLDADAVPPTLLAIGFINPYTPKEDVLGNVALANEVLQRLDRPLIEVTTVVDRLRT